MGKILDVPKEGSERIGHLKEWVFKSGDLQSKSRMDPYSEFAPHATIAISMGPTFLCSQSATFCWDSISISDCELCPIHLKKKKKNPRSALLIVFPGPIQRTLYEKFYHIYINIFW